MEEEKAELLSKYDKEIVDLFEGIMTDYFNLPQLKPSEISISDKGTGG